MATAKLRSPRKRLVLVRHAHRDKVRGSAFDNGLSRKGKRQARAAAKLLGRHLGRKHVRVVSSPLKRCIETAQPIAELLRVEIERSTLLMEPGLPDSPSEPMDKRVRRFCELWKRGDDAVVIAVGHGDWIPHCVKLLVGAEIELRKGAWAEIESRAHEPALKWIVQDPEELL